MHLLYLLQIGTCIALNTNGYVPQDVQCPATRVNLRQGNGNLSPDESAWLQNRDLKTRDELIEWLERSNLEDIDVRSYLNNKVSHNNVNSIRIGLAFSGGGFRAMLNGAGMLAALDKQTPGSMEAGGLGGLLQASTYIAGLSGGSWLVGSLAMNNWSSVPQMQANKNLWNFQNPFEPTQSNTRDVFGMFQPSWAVSVVIDVSKKQNSGHPISISDIWGRLLSAQLFEGADHGSGLLWSDLVNYEYISNHTMPLPILVTDSSNFSVDPLNDPGSYVNNKYRNPNTPTEDVAKNKVRINSSVIEVTPFEFGSWDPNVNAFINTKYLGSSLANDDFSYVGCVTGVDNVGFLIGASSTLFNVLVPQILNVAPLRAIYDSLLSTVNGLQNLVYALVGANPFVGASWITPSLSISNILKLVDGGEDGENIPLVPLIRPERNLDLVFAFDNSADTDQNWPSGMSIYTTYLRQNSVSQVNQSFPVVPDPDTMLRWNLNKRPLFFGCNINVTQAEGGYNGPVIAYVPNTYRSYPANQRTFKLNFSQKERDGNINNGYNVATMNNGTVYREWRQCVACAILLREQQRNGDRITNQCDGCFQRYCYS